jgi:hypothetical protein
MPEFDVSAESTKDYQAIRGFRWMFGIVAALVAGFLIIQEVPIVLGHRTLSSGNEFNIVFFPIVVFGLCYAFFSMGQGATLVSVSDVGVELRYRNGRTKKFGWHDRSFSLTLRRFDTDESSPRREWYLDAILTRVPYANPISSLAYDTIVGEAGRRGFELVSKQTTWQGPPIRTLVNIRVPSRSDAPSGS